MQGLNIPAGSAAPNIVLERTAGSRPLAAAAHRERSAAGPISRAENAEAGHGVSPEDLFLKTAVAVFYR